MRFGRAIRSTTRPSLTMSNKPPKVVTQPFSAGYEIVHTASVQTWQDDEAAMDFEMYETLAEHCGGRPLGFIEGRHYDFVPEVSVPSNVVSVPESAHDDPSVLLIKNDRL